MEPVIDPTPADNGSYKIQRDWRDFFNKKGKAMISASDVYKANDSILLSLREDFKKYWLITSTRIIYNSNDLQARIIHNFGSTIVQPTEKSLVVPVYRNEQVEKVAKGEGLTYLQTLFQTEDNALKLLGRLEKISGREAKDIRVETPDQDSRRICSERAVDFVCGGSWFHVDGDGWFYDDSGGQSRGVQSGAKISTGNERLVQPTLEEVLKTSRRFISESSSEEFEKSIRRLYEQ